MRDIRFIIVLSVIAFVFMKEAIAQEDGFITPEKISVVKEYEPILAKSKKLEVSPEMPEAASEESKIKSDYVDKPKFIANSFQPPKLKPLASSNKQKIEKRNIWLKAGYGNVKNPFIDANIFANVSKKINAGVQFVLDQTDEGNLKKNSYMNGNVFVKQLSTNSITKLKLAYSDYKNHFYGGYIGLGETDSLEQKYNDISFDAQFKNLFESRNGFNYNAELKVGYLTNQENIQYNWINNDLNVHLTNTYIRKSIKDNYAGLAFNTQYNALSNDASGADRIDNNNLIFYTQPHFYLNTAGLSIGANIEYDENNIDIYPAIQLKKSINENIAVYGIWEKAPVQNSFRKFILQNPFVSKKINILNSNKEERFFGFSYKVGSYGEFNVKAGQQITENMPLWTVDYSSVNSNKYHVVYDSSLTILIIKPQINLLIQDFEIAGSATFNSYTLTNQQEAWHLPDNVFNLGINYNGVKNLKAGLEMINVGERKYLNNQGQSDVLNPYFDLNLNINYSLKENISIFLEGKNLLSTEYQRWHLYENYLNQIRIGILAKL